LLFCTVIGTSSHAQSGLTLAWDRNTETSVTGYKLYCGAVSRIYTNVIYVGNATEAAVSNLVPGVTYRFAVTACNVEGLESDFSAEISHTITNSLATNLPPTLDALANMTVNEDSGPHLVSLTGISPGAAENEALLFAVSATPAWLIPAPQISYASPNSTGSLSFVTGTNLSGTGTITVYVSDGRAQISRSFSVTVNPVNDPPALTSLNSRRINENTSTGPIPFLVGDVETAAAGITVSGTSSNPSLVPNENILFGGSGSNRTVQVTPLADQFGVADITVSVSDGSLSASRTFQLTVTNVNDAPTMMPLANATVGTKIRSSLSPVLIADIDTPSTNLTVRGASSNTSVLPNGNIFIDGNGFSRALSVNALKAGTTTVTLTVSDGLAQSAQSFLLTVTNTHRFKIRPSDLATTSSGGFTLSWESTPGDTFRVLSNTDATLTNWVNRSGNIVAANEITSWTDSSAAQRAASIYIIEFIPPE